jgi:hypothetical protein
MGGSQSKNSSKPENTKLLAKMDYDDGEHFSMTTQSLTAPSPPAYIPLMLKLGESQASRSSLLKDLIEDDIYKKGLIITKSYSDYVFVIQNLGVYMIKDGEISKKSYKWILDVSNVDTSQFYWRGFYYFKDYSGTVWSVKEGSGRFRKVIKKCKENSKKVKRVKPFNSSSLLVLREDTSVSIKFLNGKQEEIKVHKGVEGVVDIFPLKKKFVVCLKSYKAENDSMYRRIEIEIFERKNDKITKRVKLVSVAKCFTMVAGAEQVDKNKVDYLPEKKIMLIATVRPIDNSNNQLKRVMVMKFKHFKIQKIFELDFGKIIRANSDKFVGKLYLFHLNNDVVGFCFGVERPSLGTVWMNYAFCARRFKVLKVNFTSGGCLSAFKGYYADKTDRFQKVGRMVIGVNSDLDLLKYEF